MPDLIGNPFDSVVIDLGRRKIPAKTIVSLLTQSLGRLIFSMYRAKIARVEEVRQVAIVLSEEMQQCEQRRSAAAAEQLVN